MDLEDTDMNNKLILHMGTPKTGTTSIQKFLYENRLLLSQNINYISWEEIENEEYM